MVNRTSSEQVRIQREAERAKALIEQPINPKHVQALGLHVARIYRVTDSLTQTEPKTKEGTVNDPRLGWLDKSVEKAQDLYDLITPDVTTGDTAIDHPDTRLPPALRFQRHGVQDKLRATVGATVLAERIRQNRITPPTIKEKAAKLRTDALFVLARLTGVTTHLGAQTNHLLVPIEHVTHLMQTHAHETNNEREHIGAKPINLTIDSTNITHIPLGAVFGLIEAYSNANKATKNTKAPKVAIIIRNSGNHDSITISNNGKPLTRNAALKLTHDIRGADKVRSGFKIDPTIGIGSGTILPLVARVMGHIDGRIRFRSGFSETTSTIPVRQNGATLVITYPKIVN